MHIERTVLPAENPPIRDVKPDSPGIILPGVRHPTTSSTRIKRPYLTVPDQTQAGFSSTDPKVVTAVVIEEDNAITGKSGGVIDVEGSKVAAIEANESVQGTQ